MMKTGRNASGFSLVEVVVATAILTMVLMMAVGFVMNARTTAKASQEKAFAVQKGISSLEEVRSFTQLVNDFGEIDGLDEDWSSTTRFPCSRMPRPITSSQAMRTLS